MGIAELLLLVVFLGICGGVLAALVAFNRRTWEAHQRAWQEFAVARGMVCQMAAVPWYQRSSVVVTGTLDLVALEFGTYVVSNGKSSTTFTRVRAHALDPIPSNIRVSTAHLFSGIGRMLGLQDVPTGDAIFDEKYVVKADREADARALLDAPTRKAMMAFPHSVRFEYEAGAVSLHWLGLENNPAVLDAAARIVAAACRWRRDPMLYR